MKTSICFSLVVALFACNARAAAPVVANVRAAQIAGTKNVEILYDVSDTDGDAQTVGVQISGDAGATYTIPATALSGHVGAGVAVGVNKRIVWNAGVDWNGQYVPLAKVRVTASDGTTFAPPPGMAFIPAGTFQMGDNFNEAGANALPLHSVSVSGFFIEKTLVKKETWQSVQIWAQGHSYSIAAGSFYGNGHPVISVTWHDMVKWCNARSELENKTPCYYTDPAQTLIYKSGVFDITNAMVKWDADGYRLPTEAEWEKAARGGTMGLRFPWGNSVSGSNGNYNGSGDAFESNTPGTTPVEYYNGTQIPSGDSMVNGYGLFDISGNVAEWCWDRYSANYYGDAAANIDPRGPNVGDDIGTYGIKGRVARGGCWALGAVWLRPASRMGIATQPYIGNSGAGIFWTGSYGNDFVLGQATNWTGIRCVRKAP